MKNPLFLPYQKKWIQDPARIKLMEKSRQIGISWATAYALIRNQSKPGNSLDAWVSSRDELQAKLFLTDCKAFATPLNHALPLLHPDTKASSLSLTLANNTTIHSLSSNPDAQAGKRGTRVLDEFALHPDPKKLYSIAYPGITWGGSLDIISTHRGSDNFFNQLILEAKHSGNPKNISLHKVTLQDALDQGFLTKLKAKLPKDDPIQDMSDADYFDLIKASCPDNETFLQEYMCQPDDYSAYFIHPHLLEQNAYPLTESWQYSPEQQRSARSTFTLGIDLGRDHDLTVFALIEHTQEGHFLRDIQTFKNTPFHQQEKILHTYMSNPKVKHAVIDQTGIGRQFAETAERNYGSHRVTGIHFTNQVKEHLAYSLRTTFEDHNLKIPQDKDLFADLRAVKKELTTSGNIRFTAKRTEDGHADRFWALALALYGKEHALSGEYYEPIKNFLKSKA